MKQWMRFARVSLLAVALPLACLHAQGIQVIPTGVVMEQWQPSGQSVHAPIATQELFPGQGVFIVIGAKDQASENEIKGASFNIEVDYQGKTLKFPGRIAKTFKRLLPQSAGDRRSLGILDCEYQVPQDGQAGILAIRCVRVRPDDSGSLPDRLEIPVKNLEEALLKAPAFATADDVDKWMKGFHRNPSLGRLFAAIRLMSIEDAPLVPTAVGFFVQTLQSSPLAAQVIMKHLPMELTRTRSYGGLLLKWAGYDIQELLPYLDEETNKTIKELPKLPDPYADLNDPNINLNARLRSLGRLWGIFMATGRPQPVQAIVQTLQWRKEFEVFENLRKKDKLPQSPTPELIKGVLYRSAGESLRTFLGTMPQLEDLLEIWKQDLSTPKAIKDELKSLSTNPAFKPAPAPGGTR